MKKVVAVVSVLVLTLSLVGCGSAEKPAAEQPAQEQPKQDEAKATEDTLKNLSYSVPAGWKSVEASSPDSKIYTTDSGSIMVTAMDAPMDLTGAEDSVVQLALVSSLKSWNELASGKFLTDEKLVDVNGLKAQRGYLQMKQNDALYDLIIYATMKGDYLFDVIMTVPDAADNAGQIEDLDALVASMR